MREDNRVKLRCQACGDAENWNFYCELIVVKGIVDYEEIVCPVSGDECEWDEVENLEAERIKQLEAKNRNLRMDVKLWKNRTTEAAKAVEDFEKLEAELKQHCWIPVSERLPKKNGDYFVYTQLKESKKMYYHSQSVGWRDGKWDYIFVAGIITHWMSIILPKQAKKGK